MGFDILRTLNSPRFIRSACSTSFYSDFSVMASSLETINVPHLPSLPVHVALYRDVQNAAFLKGQLLAGNAEFEYALIDASMVCEDISS